MWFYIGTSIGKYINVMGSEFQIFLTEIYRDGHKFIACDPIKVNDSSYRVYFFEVDNDNIDIKRLIGYINFESKTYVDIVNGSCLSYRGC